MPQQQHWEPHPLRFPLDTYGNLVVGKLAHVRRRFRTEAGITPASMIIEAMKDKDLQVVGITADRKNHPTHVNVALAMPNPKQESGHDLIPVILPATILVASRRNKAHAS